MKFKWNAHWMPFMKMIVSLNWDEKEIKVQWNENDMDWVGNGIDMNEKSIGWIFKNKKRDSNEMKSTWV